MSALELCEKYFACRDVYKLFGIERTANEKEIKKGYYKLSLLVHPDRVPESEKANATEKFKLLSKLYQILTDKEKRKLYDEQGIIDDDDDLENLDAKLNNWLDLWRKLFKPLTVEDIENYEKSYINSPLERADIRKAYLAVKGCINKIIDEVPFMKVEDEPRLQEIVRSMIDAGEVPEYKIFTEEPIQKRKRRHKKYAKESKEAAEIAAEIKKKSEANNSNVTNDGDMGSLEKAIIARQRSRENNFNSIIDKLMQKYGNEDNECEDDSIDITLSSKKKKKTTSKTDKTKGRQLHNVKVGKIKKK